jgi:hypothetical protein
MNENNDLALNFNKMTIENVKLNGNSFLSMP